MGDTLPTKDVQVLDITIALGAADGPSRCHLDLAARTVTGTLCPLAEDLRDFLRRHTIWLFTDQPFRSLPPANLARLCAGRQRQD